MDSSLEPPSQPLKVGFTATQRFDAVDAKYADRLASMSMEERGLLGLPYLPNDPKLMAQRLRARQLEYEYNHSPPGASPPSIDRQGNVLDAEQSPLHDVANRQRQRIIGQLFDLSKEMSKRIFLEPPFHVDFGFNIKFKGDFFANAGLCILDVAEVTIGQGVLFGPAVHIYAATHSVSVAERSTGFERALPVSIGDDCWVGGNSCIMAGVTIGRGCTVGAGSVVTRDIPDFSVALGNPARVVKTLNATQQGDLTGERKSTIALSGIA